MRQVAKEVRISHLTEKQKEGALAESKVLQLMKHSNIISHIDTFMEGARLYIVMEYADGGDLAAKIKDRKDGPHGEVLRFQECEVMFVFVQIVLALQHIHAQNVLHRDLKPLNIFLTRQGVVKLGDFGIARVIDNSVGAQTTIGTPHYLSPEICNSEPYGTKSDLWSLGVVTYELAALRVPFHGTSLPAVALQIIGADPEPLPESYSADLSQIVFGLLDKMPQKRPRLDRVLSLKFVQQYIKRNLSHTIHAGSGGLEALGVHIQACRESKVLRQEQSPSVLRFPDNLPLETVSSCPLVLAAGVPQKELVRVASGGNGKHPQPRQRSHQAAVEDDWYRRQKAASEREYFQNRQMAAETKQRVEQEHRGPNSFGGVGSGGRRHAASSEEVLQDAERRKAEVRRRAQEQKDEAEVARKRELERAAQEVSEDRRRLQLRMLALQDSAGAAEVAEGSAASQSAPQKQVCIDAAAAADASPSSLSQRGGQSDDDHADEDHTDTLEQAYCEAAEAQQRLPETNAAALQDDSRRHVEIVIPFTDKVRPKPKLSSEGRPPRRRSAPRSAAPETEECPIASGGASSSASLGPGPRGVRGRSSSSLGARAGTLPVDETHSRKRREAHDGRAQPMASLVSTTSRRPPRPSGGGEQRQMAGSPARWLPKQAPPEGDFIHPTGPSAAAVTVPARDLLPPKDSVGLLQLNLPSSPQGLGDLSLLQDALAGALCNAEER